MSSRARNFRRRSDSEEDDSSNPSSDKAKPSAPPRPRLSFADEDAGDDGFGERVKIRSASSSRRPTGPGSSTQTLFSSSRDRRASAVAAPKPTNLQPQSGEYTDEKLLQLKKLARPLPGSGGAAKVSSVSSSNLSISSSVPNVASQEPVVVLRGLIKPVSDSSAAKGEDHEDDDEGEDDIPDKATIEAVIRARRQRTQRKSAPDFIPLDAKGKDRVSSDEEEDVRERIGVLSAGTKGVFEWPRDVVLSGTASVGNGVFGDVHEDDEDEEERKWEEEQFRKALGRKIEDAPVQRMASHSIPATVPIIGPQPFAGHSVGLAPAGVSVFAPQNVEPMTIAHQAEVATKALQDNLSKLKETHKATLSSLDRTETQLSEALAEISSLENSMEATDKKYKYMQEMKEYVIVICDFLNGRSFMLEELEERMQKLHKDRAESIFERRQADLTDEANEVEAAVNAALSVLSKGSSSANVSAATVAAKAAVEAARAGSRLPQELDEYGRDISMQKRMDIRRRADKRKQRRDRAESKRISSVRSSGACELTEGEVSTDESDHDDAAYDSSRNQMLETAAHIFSEASDEYSNLKLVKEKLEGWKFMYPASYNEAYAALSVPALFAPFVRLELLEWDPLYDPKDFLYMKWHELLFDYGIQCKDADFDTEDIDANLVPQLVEKLALPILHHEILYCWDILSTKRTANAVLATRDVFRYVPASSKALKELITVVNDRLTEAISGLTVPTWGPVVMKSVPNAAQYAAYRFGVSVRLLKNICLWKNLLDQQALEKLAFEDLLKGKILPHVKSIASDLHDAITRTERIVASLSGILSGSDARSNKRLQPLVDFVTDLGRKLEKRLSSGLDEEETRALARRLKNMLAALNEHDRARTILRTFQLREAV